VDDPDYYKKIDKAMIQEAAKTYLNTNRYVEVMLFPERNRHSLILSCAVPGESALNFLGAAGQLSAYRQR